MTIPEFVSQVPAERQELFAALHDTIMANDPSVKPAIKPMMGKDMILYEEQSYMKYGLANTKNYMSLHCMPIYMHPTLHAKYAQLLPAAQFQKGCINFKQASEVPLATIAALIADCSKVNIAQVLENRKMKSKSKTKR